MLASLFWSCARCFRSSERQAFWVLSDFRTWSSALAETTRRAATRAKRSAIVRADGCLLRYGLG